MNPLDSKQARWFAEEVQPHEGSLRQWLQRRFPSICDVDDIVQESYLRVLKANESGLVESTRAYLFATARNLAVNHLRHRRVENADSLTEIVESCVVDKEAGVAESVAHAQEIELLNQAIQSLPKRCRQVVVLRKIKGLSQREVARHLGISENTVEAQGAIGLRKITRFFDRHDARGARP